MMKLIFCAITAGLIYGVALSVGQVPPDDPPPVAAPVYEKVHASVPVSSSGTSFTIGPLGHYCHDGWPNLYHQSGWWYNNHIDGSAMTVTKSAMVVIASVYWPGDGVVRPHDHGTSSGQRYNAKAMTCAHKTYPLGTKLLLRYGNNAAEVTVNDRGPFVRGREIDMTPAVAKALHFPGLGRINVTYFPPLPRSRP